MDWTFMRLIPAAPLLVAVGLAVSEGWPGRRPSRRTVSLAILLATGASFLFSILAFWELLESDETSALVDPIATWIGVGVGHSALSGDFVFRLDTLSIVFALAISGLGLLILFYSLLEMRVEVPDDARYARFFCLASFQLASSLILVLADNMAVVLLGYGGVILGNGLLAGFRYGDGETRSAHGALRSGWVGQAALLLATLLIFRFLSELGAPALAIDSLRSALPELAGLRLVGWGQVELSLYGALALCILLAACALASQLPLVSWLPASDRIPLGAGALLQTVTSLPAGAYLIARFSFLFTVAPGVAETMAWLGGASAFFGALMAARSNQVGRVLAWSSVSQLGLVWAAAGAGAQTSAVFHLLGHSFSKGLLLVATGVVVLALAGGRDLWRMGHLASRLTLTRLAFWVGALSLVGSLPLTVGFFSTNQVLVAVQGADQMASHFELLVLLLMASGLTAFYSVRFVFLILYGENRLPQSVHLEEVGDPALGILWALGILATLSVLGAMIGLPQFCADFFFDGDVVNSNSLHYFLSGVVSTMPETTLGMVETWSLMGWGFVATSLGLLAALMRYVSPAAGSGGDGLPWDRFLALLQKPIARFEFGRRRISATLATRIESRGGIRFSDPSTWGRGGAAAVQERGNLSLSAGLLRFVADRLLKFAQSGVAQHYLAISMLGSLAVLIYFLWAGRG